jgi:hypothetical protein
MFVFVLALVAIAAVTMRIRGWAIQRVIIGLLVVLLAVLSCAKVQMASAERKAAFQRGQWASATLGTVEYGYHAPPRLTFRVTTPSCDYEFSEQVSIPFARALGCTPDAGCPEDVAVRVALGTPLCSSAYADPKSGALEVAAVSAASAVGALAGALFMWFGLRERKRGTNQQRDPQ